MPIINRLSEFHADLTKIRREIHANPELGYEEIKTGALVKCELESYGVDEIHTGLGRTGLVAIIKGRKTDSGKTIGLRADMDALPINEARPLEYASKTKGVMHACGHDGHTTMLLGAARYLAETRNFDGTAVLIFQPAEEGKAGALAMIKDGLMEKFGIEQVYGMHNMPGIPEGDFAIRVGSMMAAADQFEIEIEGKGAHGAMPQFGIDPIVVGSAMVQAVQSIVSRNADSLEALVVSITTFNSGNAFNVIPQSATLTGTVRTLNADVQDMAEKRLGEIVENVAHAFGATATLSYKRNYPITINHEAQTGFAAKIAGEIVGDNRVNTQIPPLMGAEDFSFMLQEKPGAFIFLGQGDTAQVHHPDYDFNDDIIPTGCSYWVKLVETALPISE